VAKKLKTVNAVAFVGPSATKRDAQNKPAATAATAAQAIPCTTSMPAMLAKAIPCGSASRATFTLAMPSAFKSARLYPFHPFRAGNNSTVCPAKKARVSRHSNFNLVVRLDMATPPRRAG
jgi:hypothetical protein